MDRDAKFFRHALSITQTLQNDWFRRQQPIPAEILSDDTLSDEERDWMKEMENLELPRRHLVW